MYRIFLAFIIMLYAPVPALSQEPNLDEVYKDSFRNDIPFSMQPIPFEDKDHKRKHYSPYSLVRFPRACKHYNDVFTPGYYLVKPFEENNVSYLLFKKNNVAVALVPVVSKSEMKKKKKKMELSLIEDQHGKYYILNVKYKLSSYFVKLEIVH